MNKLGLMACALAPAALLGCADGSAGSANLQIEQMEVTSDGATYFLRGALGQVDTSFRDAAQAQQALAAALPAIAEALGAPGAQLVAVSTERDSLGMTHVRMAQQKNGLRVVGGDAIVQIDSTGAIRTVTGALRDRDLSSTPSFAAEDAAQIALKDSENGAKSAASELAYVVSNRDGELYLAWEIGVQSGIMYDLVYVDAISGKVVDRHPQVFTLKNRTIRNGNGGTFPVNNAPIVGTEASPPTDPVALAAFNNTGVTYDCYKELYNRDSYNNAGAALNSQVHVVFATGNGGTSPNNAVWSAQVGSMAYGDGDGVQMKELAYALDVTAHELTHAVTSATANLVYQNESGALNESMSDIMGAVCEAWKAKAVSANTWLVGEEIWTPATPNDALRYMHSPTLDTRSPDYYPERFTGTADNGGVHLNSGLPNLAFYLLSQGGKHPRAKTTNTVPALGIDKAGAIFQRALTTKFTANTNMAQARTLTQQTAAELYPGTCAAIAVDAAWAAVGVGGPAPTDAVAPTAQITAPAADAKVDAGFAVEATVTDDTCVHKVELWIDGTLAQTLTAAPYSFTTDTNLAAGAHTVELRAYDAFNVTSSTANVTIGGKGNGGGGGGDGDGDNSTLTGGCSTGGTSGGGLLLGLALVLGLRRRRR
ncbi:MAG: M4 family metallopeptidase [Kofleriaceae bacterium]